MFDFILMYMWLIGVGGILLSMILLFFFQDEKYEQLLFSLFFWSALIGGIGFFILSMFGTTGDPR